MARQGLNEYVDGIVKCPICLEHFNEPKSLPCLHTFCLQCITSHCRNISLRSTGRSTCPVCRKAFQIPPGGLDKLTTNFVMQDLRDVRNAKRFNVCQCGSRRFATNYCAECSLVICQECANTRHGRHLVGPVGTGVDYCRIHSDKELMIFCTRCLQNLCPTCHLLKHRDHECADIVEICAEYRRTLRDDQRRVDTVVADAKQEQQRIAQRRANFRSRLDQIKRDVENVDAMLALQRRVDGIVDKLINTLIYEETDTKVFDDRLQLALARAQSFVKFTDDLLKAAKPCKITQYYNELHSLANDIMEQAKKIRKHIRGNVISDALHSTFIKTVEDCHEQFREKERQLKSRTKAQNETSEERLRTNENGEPLERLQAGQLQERSDNVVEGTNSLRRKLESKDRVNKKLLTNVHLMKQNEQARQDYILSLREMVKKSELRCKRYEEILRTPASLHIINETITEERIKKIHFRYRLIILVLVAIAVLLHWVM